MSMNHHEGLKDVTRWPGLCTSSLSEKEAATAERRIQAIRKYFAGLPRAEIKAQTGVDRRRLHTLIRRCQSLHPDGQIFGFRACRPQCRVKAYQRSAPLQGQHQGQRRGHAGLLGQLFRNHPSIPDELISSALRRRGFVETSVRFTSLHRKFLELCRDVGIKDHEYPFNVLTQAKGALRRHLKAQLLSRDVRAVVDKMFGEETARKLGDSHVPVRTGSITQCYDRVEFDAHRADVLAIIEIVDPSAGMPAQLVLDRFWVLVVIDRASRAVLGYHVSLGVQYTAEDVLICLENAILPWTPRPLSIAGLAYIPGSGLPSGIIPELAYAKWGEFAFDNAKSNCATWVWETAQREIGCSLVPGPPADPEYRPIVERFFRTLEDNGFHRLPTTTGSSPKDPRRRDPDEAALRFNVRLDDILDLLDVKFAAYNATPSDALNGRSPLEHLRFALERRCFLPRQIPEGERSLFCLTRIKFSRKIGGSLRSGKRPYLEFEGARYYSHKLAESPVLIGQKVTIECNTRDMRYIKVFLPNGDEFDTLTVEQAFAYRAHDLRTRRAINRCIFHGRLRKAQMADVVGAFIDHKQREAKKSKRARNVVAHAAIVEKRAEANKPVPFATAKPITPAPQRARAPRLSLRLHTLNF